MKVLVYFAIQLLMMPKITFAQEACWQNEIDPWTKKTFASEELWQNALDGWNQVEPPAPGPKYIPASEYYYFWLAKGIYNSELEAVKKLKGDKRKHCYLGCRIAQDVSYETATYVAWLKEYEDITDCNSKTFFEPLDRKATIDGAALSKQTKDAQACFDFCSLYSVK